LDKLKLDKKNKIEFFFLFSFLPYKFNCRTLCNSSWELDDLQWEGFGLNWEFYQRTWFLFYTLLQSYSPPTSGVSPLFSSRPARECSSVNVWTLGRKNSPTQRERSYSKHETRQAKPLRSLLRFNDDKGEPCELKFHGVKNLITFLSQLLFSNILLWPSQRL